LLWDLNARNHEVTLLKIKHVRLSKKYGEAEIPHESKTGSGPALLMCSFPYVRDWLNEHPFRNEPNANIICNVTTGSAITADTLATAMKQLRKRIIDLLQSGSITDSQEKENLDRLIKTKKWNPYCIRHSAITADSDFLPEFALRKKARWVMNSKQPARYIKARMGNDLKQKILVQNGIVPENSASVRPAPTIAECGRCQLVNPLENKYCSSCGYPLSVVAYEELKAADNAELNKLKTQVNQLSADLYTLISNVERDNERLVKKSAEGIAFSRLVKRSPENPELMRDFTRQMESGKVDLPPAEVALATTEIKAKAKARTTQQHNTT
jgi:hypothetical protein